MKTRITLTTLLLMLVSMTWAQTYWDGTADKNLPGEGTEASPYLISTPEQLAGLAARVNDDGEDFKDKFIKLANDIYLTELAEGKGTLDWEPIGHEVWEWGKETQYAYFRGTFDGDGHTIYNLYYGNGSDFGVGFDPLDFDTELSEMDYSTWCKGLFCHVDGGTVKNVNLQNAIMSGAWAAAILVTYLTDGATVKNCHVQGKMHGRQVSLGGICNRNEGIIENCMADIETDGASVAGIVVENAATGIVRDCSATVTARCTAGNGAGCVSSNYGLVERCSASVDIQALYGTAGAINSSTGYYVYSVHNAAGFVDTNYEGGIIRECSATGDLASEGNGLLGGFALYNYGRIESCYCTGTLRDVTDPQTLAGNVRMAQFTLYNGEPAEHYGDTPKRGDCINCFTTSVCELRKDAGKADNNYQNACAAFLFNYYHGQEGFTDPDVSYSNEIGCYYNKDGIPQYSNLNNNCLGQEYTVEQMQSQAFVDELNKMARFMGTSQWERREGGLPRATGVIVKSVTDFFGGGDGTRENPYLVSSKEQLEGIAYLVGRGFDFDKCYVRQTADIALNAPMEQWGEEMPTEWQPIGSVHTHELLTQEVAYPFRGTYDGGFHEVQNMYIDNLLGYQGLFGLLGRDVQGRGATIRNLGVTNAYVRAQSAGVLAGKVYEGYNLIQCWTSGEVGSQGSDPRGVGAMAFELGGKGHVLNCMSTAKLLTAPAGTVDTDSRAWANDSLVNYIYAGVLGTRNANVPSAWFQYVENPFLDADVAGSLGVNVEYDRTTAWLQSKECANVLNDAVTRWNADHSDDADLQLNYWEWREGQYPRVSPEDDYLPGVAVAFESNGGSAVETKRVEAGSLIEAPDRPSKEGLVFAGWYKDEALTQFFDFEHTAIEESMTLYAKWLEDTRFDYDLTPFNNKFATTYHIKTAAQLRGFAVACNGEYTITTMVDGTSTSYTFEQTRAPQSFEGKTVVLDNDIFLNDTTDWHYWGHDGYAVPWKPIGSYTSGYVDDVPFNGTFDGQGHCVYGMYIETGGMPMSNTYNYGLFGLTERQAVIKNVGVRASVIDLLDHQHEPGRYPGTAGKTGMLVGKITGTSLSQCFAEGYIVNANIWGIGELVGSISYIATSSVAFDNCYSRVTVTKADGTANGSFVGDDGRSPQTFTNCYTAGTENIVSNTNGYFTTKTAEEMKQQATYAGWNFDEVWGIHPAVNDGYPYLRVFNPEIPITPAVITTAPAAVDDLVYMGEPQTLITAGEAEGGEMQYSLDGETYTTELPTATNAGQYTVYYKVVADAEHTDLEAQTLTATIAKAAGVISFAESSMSKTYGDADFTNELTNNGDGVVIYASDNTEIATIDSETGLVTITGAGAAIIKATVVDGTNYTYATKTAQYTLTVTAATGIGSVASVSSADTNEGWYSLDGRKLQNKPTTKGMFIHDGKKVVIK